MRMTAAIFVICNLRIFVVGGRASYQGIGQLELCAADYVMRSNSCGDLTLEDAWRA
jgi:hypothetical protein